MPRAQNAHAYVNAAFLVRVDPNDKYKVLDTPTIVFGSITPNFVRIFNNSLNIVKLILLHRIKREIEFFIFIFDFH